jgi:hypothetical protein
MVRMMEGARDLLVVDVWNTCNGAEAVEGRVTVKV